VLSVFMNVIASRDAARTKALRVIRASIERSLHLPRWTLKTGH
jgi:hypothetical protein